MSLSSRLYTIAICMPYFHINNAMKSNPIYHNMRKKIEHIIKIHMLASNIFHPSGPM
jgi:hypothetical protein